MQRTELIPPQFREGAERMAEAFRHVDQVIVAAHVNPDGDAAGAVAAAGHILRSMGKEFMLYAQPGLPGYLDFFPRRALCTQRWSIRPSSRAARCCLTAANPSALAASWRGACRICKP